MSTATASDAYTPAFHPSSIIFFTAYFTTELSSFVRLSSPGWFLNKANFLCGRDAFKIIILLCAQTLEGDSALVSFAAALPSCCLHRLFRLRLIPSLIFQKEKRAYPPTQFPMDHSCNNTQSDCAKSGGGLFFLTDKQNNMRASTSQNC